MKAIILLGHGSHFNPYSSLPIHKHAKTIKELNLFDEVKVAFWKEQPEFNRILDSIESDTVYLCPIFMSEGYFTKQIIPREIQSETKKLIFLKPVGSHDLITEIVLDLANKLGINQQSNLVILGHGTKLNSNSEKNIYYHAEKIRERNLVNSVTTVFLDQEPGLEHLKEIENPIIIPLFIADGWHVEETIPVDINSFQTDYKISPAVGTDNRIIEIILDHYNECK